MSNSRLLRALRRNLVQAVPTIAGIVVLDFLLLQLAPGDAADVMAAESGVATTETMAAIRHHFGLDLPVLERLGNYLTTLAHGSLGYSPRYDMPVAELVGQRLPTTLTLMGLSLTLAIGLGVAFGAVMALSSSRALDRALSAFLLLFYSLPGFWIGLMLIVLFSVKLGWLPTSGVETSGSSLTGWAEASDRFAHLILPAASLAMFYLAIYARLTRASVLEVASQDYVRTATAKGLPPAAVVIRHIVRNALGPVSTMAGVQIGGILGGSVVIETVFGLPGLGRLAFEAVMKRDFSVLLGVLLLSSLLVIIVNMLVDLVQTWLDPRIEVR
jgi:peptide/nickel transport system permease protein